MRIRGEGIMRNRLKTIVAILFGVSLVVSAGSALAELKDSDEVPLVLTGCVVAAEQKGEYFIKNTVVSGAGMSKAPAGAAYRLDDAKDLRSHIGHQVEVHGLADLGDIDDGWMKVQRDGTSTQSQPSSATVAVNSERNTVTAKVAALAFSGGEDDSVDA
jgi:hypothetical protein